MPRPTSNPLNLKKRVISLRLTESQFQQIEAAALRHHLTPAEYLKELGLQAATRQILVTINGVRG